MQIKAVVLFAAGAAAGIAIEKRYPPDYCHRDNCFRNLLLDKYVSSATGFCATWLRTTSTQTDYAIFSTSETSTSTPETVTATEDATVTKTVTTGTETITQYFTSADPRYKKRDGLTDYPPWLSTSCVESRVTSACSCFLKEKSLAPLTVWETITVTTATDVISFTETLPTSTETITETETSTENVTAETTLSLPLKCGIKGCGKILLVDDVAHKSSRSGCKTWCAGKANCKSYAWTPDIVGNGGTCTISKGKSDADTFYSPLSPNIPIPCAYTRIYDVLC